MSSPSVFTKLFSSTAAQVALFATLAAGVSYLAGSAGSNADVPVGEPAVSVVAHDAVDPATNNAAGALNTKQVGSEPTGAATSNAGRQAAGPVLPEGLAVASSPVAPNQVRYTSRLPAKQPSSQSTPASTKHTFKKPDVPQVKPWFKDGPTTAVASSSERGVEATWENDSALLHTDQPYYDGRFTHHELGEINRIRGLDRDGKLQHVSSLDRVRTWVDDLSDRGHVSPELGEVYDVRLDHAEYLYDEATVDGNLEPSKPVGILSRVASTVLDFVPIVGNAKSAYEALVGVDPITGEELSALDRAAAAGSVVIPGLKFVKKGVNLVKGIVKYGDEAIEVGQFVAAAKKAEKASSGAAGRVLLAPAKRNSGVTVIGRYPDYVKLSDKLNARRFEIPVDKWKRMSPTEQWAANQKFLDRTIARGDKIRLASTVDKATDSSSYLKELKYFFSKGYKLDSTGTILIPPRP